MKTFFSTDDVHPRDRFDYWHNVACKNLVDHDSEPESRQSFGARIEAGHIADIGLVSLEHSPMDVAHSQHHMARSRSDELFVCRQVSGVAGLEQCGREVRLEPADITLVDPLLPYAGRFSSGSNLLVLKVPRRALEARIGKTREMTCRSIKPSQAENGLTSSFLAMLPGHADKMGPAADEVIKNQTLDLIAVSLTKAMEAQTPKLSSARSLALVKVRAAVEARLTDPRLNSNAVAAAAGVSVRYANAVLAQEGTSVARLIQTRRLGRCRKALEDPLQTHRTISDIAYGWGFSDMTHFSRRFKAAYGLSPTEYRHAQRRVA